MSIVAFPWSYWSPASAHSLILCVRDLKCSAASEGTSYRFGFIFPLLLTPVWCALPSMAVDFPLVLYGCDFPGLAWQGGGEELHCASAALQQQWTRSAVETHVYRAMLRGLEAMGTAPSSASHTLFHMILPTRCLNRWFKLKLFGSSFKTLNAVVSFKFQFADVLMYSMYMGIC